MARHVSVTTQSRFAAPETGGKSPAVFKAFLAAPEAEKSEFSPAPADAVMALEEQVNRLGWQAAHLQDIAAEIERAGGNSADVGEIRENAAGLKEIVATVQHVLRQAARDQQGNPKLPAMVISRLQAHVAGAMAAGTTEAKNAEVSHSIASVVEATKKIVADLADEAKKKAEREREEAEKRARAKRAIVIAIPTITFPDWSQAFSLSGTSSGYGAGDSMFDLSAAHGISLPTIQPTFLNPTAPLWNGIQSGAEHLGTLAVNVGDSIGVGMNNLIASDSVQSAGTALKNAGTTVVSVVENGYNAAAEKVNDAANVVGNAAKDAAETVSDAASRAADKVSEKLAEAKQAAIETAQAAKAKLVKAAQWAGLLSPPKPEAPATKPILLTVDIQAIAGQHMGIQLSSAPIALTPASLGNLNTPPLPITAALLRPAAPIIN